MGTRGNRNPELIHPRDKPVGVSDPRPPRPFRPPRPCGVGESVAVLALLLAVAAPAQDRAEHVIPSLTNSATLTAVWTEQVAYGVSATLGGRAEGTSNGWYEVGTVVSNRAVAYPECVFAGWENVPAGLETNETIVFALESAWTNARATFAIPLVPLRLGPGAGEEPSFAVQAWRTGRIQRCEGSFTNGDWRDVESFGYGTTNWTDTTATGEWRILYYRLVQ